MIVTSPAISFLGFGGGGVVAETSCLSQSWKASKGTSATVLGGQGFSSSSVTLQASRPVPPWDTDQVLMVQAEMLPSPEGTTQTSLTYEVSDAASLHLPPPPGASQLTVSPHLASQC